MTRAFRLAQLGSAVLSLSCANASLPPCSPDVDASPVADGVAHQPVEPGVFLVEADGGLIVVVGYGARCAGGILSADFGASLIFLDVPPAAECLGAIDIGQHPLDPDTAQARISLGVACNGDVADRGTLELTSVDLTSSGHVDGEFEFESSDEGVSRRFHAVPCLDVAAESLPNCR